MGESMLIYALSSKNYRIFFFKQKYQIFYLCLQESKKDEENMRTWQYFSAMDSFLSCEGEMATK
uniref:Uncharacterized protein n=1 Tax=Aegilops tauschii subsp. strangulata TaxID=200361 RepID=A0A453NX92_AEGTS